MKTPVSRYILMALMLFTTGISIISSCSKDEPASSSQTAIVSGRVITPSGKPVAAAVVKAGTHSVHTNTNGNFSLILDPGNYQLVMQTGQGRMFRTTLAISLDPGEHLTLTPTQATLKQVKNLAFIPGLYDAIQTIITDSLGYFITPITVNDLSSLGTISNYGGLFLNCGLLNGGLQMDSLKYVNLMSYVSNQGSIYASDFAVECLTGDGNLRLSGPMTSEHGNFDPEKTATVCISPLIGGFIPDSSLCTQKLGPIGIITAELLDPDLITATGNDSLDIVYDLSGWEVVHSYDIPFTPIITCSGLGVLALKADLNGTAAGGDIWFTSFHNYPQGISNEVEAILNYIILNM